MKFCCNLCVIYVYSIVGKWLFGTHAGKGLTSKKKHVTIVLNKLLFLTGG